MAKPLWTFKCYVNWRNRDVIDEWHGDLSATARANFQRAREHLSAQPKAAWSRPHASPLGNHIYVIRFKDESRMQHRVCGHFPEDRDFFVMTLPAIEKDDKYEPSNYIQLATTRKNECDAGLNERARGCFGKAKPIQPGDRGGGKPRLTVIK